MTLFSFGYLMFCLLTPQRELSFKVQIFEKKVESYKKMTHKLNNAMEYIKVKLLSHLKLSVEQQEQCTVHRFDFIHVNCVNSLLLLDAVSSWAGREADQGGV